MGEVDALSAGVAARCCWAPLLAGGRPRRRTTRLGHLGGSPGHVRNLRSISDTQQATAPQAVCESMNERFSSSLVATSGKSRVAGVPARQTYDAPLALLSLLPPL